MSSRSGGGLPFGNLGALVGRPYPPPVDRGLLEENSMPRSQRLLGRRTFLLVATAAAAAWGSLRPALPGSPRPAPGAGLGLVFKHRDSAIAIGRRYLDRYPDDALPAVLAEHANTGDPAAARSALRAGIRQDFERGDTVLLDGWVLARSECRACAALALAAGAAG
jgi:hypothetical protein